MGIPLEREINLYLWGASVRVKRPKTAKRGYRRRIQRGGIAGIGSAPRGRKNCTDLGYCVRQELNIPRGERYELCRSVHAEANAIISASRDKMIGSTLYLSGREADTGEYVKNASCCSMCKRMVINAGIEKVVIRDDDDNYRVVDVRDWVEDDESLSGMKGY